MSDDQVRPWLIFRVQGPWRTKADLLWGSLPSSQEPLPLAPALSPSSHLCSLTALLDSAESEPSPRHLELCPVNPAFHEVGAVRWKGGHCGQPCSAVLRERERWTGRQTEDAVAQGAAEMGSVVPGGQPSTRSGLPGAWMLPPSGVKRQPYIFMVPWSFSLILAWVSITDN